jgi:hypothetical protein
LAENGCGFFAGGDVEGENEITRHRVDSVMDTNDD